MGYTLTIGELVVEKNPEDGLDCSCLRFAAEGVHLEEAPAFGEPTDHTNSRWPSYSGWSDFAKSAGLYEVIFTSDGHLVEGHPGVRLVTAELVECVGSALAAFKVRHPAAVAEFEGENSSPTLCRLIWLDYWLKWSLKNCETPVIANS